MPLPELAPWVALGAAALTTVLVGAVGFGAPAKLVRYRAMIADWAARDTVLAQSDAATAIGG